MSSRLHPVVSALALAVVAGCATVGPAEDIRPGERPDIETDEAGLWMYMDQMEARLKSSGRVVTDPELNAYVGDIICSLTPHYCEDIRFYIVRTPYFNATMAPNGYMQVWTGLLLRAQSEAQLAYVLGHEIGHFQRRHTLQRWRDARNKTNATAIFQVATAAAGVGYVGSIAELAAYASMLSFSRDQEREADDIGFEFMVQAGYEPGEAAAIWEALLEEREASDDPEQSIFFSTHPSTEERIATLRERAEELSGGDVRRVTGRETHLRQIRAYRSEWIRDELRRRAYAESEVMLEHLLAGSDDSGELRFFMGELYRLRDEEGDGDRAIRAYREAQRAGGAPPEVHRSLGLVYWHKGERDDARAAFEEYLRVSPEAPDREMIEVYLGQLESS